MAGGNWTSQNKVRPGVYIRFRSATQNALSIGDRGVVAICEPLDWGPTAVVTSISASDDVTNITGYDMYDSHNRFLQEIFKGSNRTAAPRKVLLYRPLGASAASASVTTGNLTATAKYVGARGNNITIAITALTGGGFEVSTIVSGVIVDTQEGSVVSDLKNNDWVSFTGTGALAATVGATLTGGSNGTVSSTQHASFLSAIESYKFDIICYDGNDATTKAAYVAFVKRIAEENGQYAQAVISGGSSNDSRFVINVRMGVVLEDGTNLEPQQATWWVAGAEAGARYNESLTYAQYPGAVAIYNNNFTNADYITYINAGLLCFNSDEGVVKVETDINTLTTPSDDISLVYRKNRVMRLLNTIANDIYAEFSRNYIGVVNNNEVGRSRFKSAIVGYLLEIQSGNGIQNFDPNDVTVEKGNDIDAVVINVAITPVDAVEKIYMTIEVA